MDQGVVTVDQFMAAMASIQEALASLRQYIDNQQMPQAPPYILHGHFKVASPTVVHTTVLEDTHACMDRIEQRIKQLRVSDSSAAWDDLEGH
ncbi:hypothetical protein AAG906_022491 [Vitis piasezkii]